MLDDLKMIHMRDSRDLLGQAAKRAEAAGAWLQTQAGDWLPEIPTSRNIAKQLAEELIGRLVIITSGPIMFPAAEKWAQTIRQYAQNVAWASPAPQAAFPLAKPYAVIDIRSKLESEQVQRRVITTDRRLSGRWPSPNIVKPQGKTLEQQLSWTAAYADFVSLYLALLNGVDPAAPSLLE